MKTLSTFIEEIVPKLKHGAVPRAATTIEPKKYVVAIQPRLDESFQPFAYIGAVYIIFVTNVDYVESLQLDCNGLALENKSKVKIFRIVEQIDGPIKRYANESELASPHEVDETAEENTTVNEIDENVAATTMKTKMTTIAATPRAPIISSTTAPVHGSSSTPTQSPEGYSSALQVFSNYFLKYEDHHSEMLTREVIADGSNGTITVKTRLSLRKGSLYVLKIEFDGTMTESGYGFLLSSYVDESQTRRYEICHLQKLCIRHFC